MEDAFLRIKDDRFWDEGATHTDMMLNQHLGFENNRLSQLHFECKAQQMIHPLHSRIHISPGHFHLHVAYTMCVQLSEMVHIRTCGLPSFEVKMDQSDVNNRKSRLTESCQQHR